MRRLDYYLDEHIDFPGYPGMPEASATDEEAAAFCDQMRARRFDLVFQMHGSGVTTNALVARFGAHRVAAYHPPGGPLPAGAVGIPYPDAIPEPHRHLRLAEAAGFPPLGDELEFPVYAADLDERDALLARYRIREGRYVVVHTGARDARRRWPTHRFAAVADAVAQLGYEVLLTGTSQDCECVHRTQAAMSEAALDLAGQLSLGGMAALIAGARLLVSNDTGPSHLAAAVGAPSVVVMTLPDPACAGRWAPLNARLHRTIQPALPPLPGLPGEIPVGPVLEAVRAQLRTAVTPVAAARPTAAPLSPI